MVVGRVLGIPFIRSQSAASGPTDFAALGDCRLWLDGQDASTQWQDAAGTTPAGIGDTIQKWDDKSGNGDDVSRVQVIASVSDSNLNSNRGVYGGGGMQATLSSPIVASAYTIFAVTEKTGADLTGYLSDGDNATNRSYLLYIAANSRIGRASGPSSGTNPDAPTVLCWVVRGAGSQMFADNVQVGSNYNDTSTTYDGLTLGMRYDLSGSLWYGYIGDYIVYANDFSVSARENISNLLAAKYGI